MKHLILSRKGVDSSSGRLASPIFPDGTIASIPIPQRGGRAPAAYDDIRFGGVNCGDLVEDLSRGKINRARRAHLDPDLRADAVPRRTGWRPIFGQADAAQGALRNLGIEIGDLFLFFGRFRPVEQVRQKWRYKRGAGDIHLIFGWMEIGEIVNVDAATGARYPWASGHPHLFARENYRNNTIYVAARTLSFDPRVAGAGTFERYDDALRMTENVGGAKMSNWSLPGFFAPRGRTPLSRTVDSQWTIRGARACYRYVGMGQEFVLDADEYPEARAWLRSLFALAPRRQLVAAARRILPRRLCRASSPSQRAGRSGRAAY